MDTRHSVAFSVDIPINNNNNDQLFGDLLKITRDRVTQVILVWVTAIKYVHTRCVQ